MGLVQLLESNSLSLSKTVAIFSGIYLLYLVGVGIHRLYFSPYSKFPGPKLAGLTYGYMFYYDALGVGGQYIYKIQQLHEEYGTPVIRISPHELHVNDPNFYDVLFAGAPSKRDKPPTWSHAFGIFDSIFGTISHDKHRLRRNAVARFFSTAFLRKLEPTIQENISRLIAVFREYQKAGEVLQMKPAFGALTSDIITEYCFGVSENYIEAPDFNAMVLETTEKLTEIMHITVHCPWLPRLMNSLPEALIAAISGRGMALLFVLKRHCVAKIKEAMDTRGDYSNVKYKTIFHDVLDNESLPEADKSIERLSQESQTLLAAGTATTANSLAAALVYLLLDQKRLQVLIEELEEAMPDISKPVKEAELEKLPYLSAVIEETLRLYSGISYRLARSAPMEVLQLGEWTIPPNVAVSMHAPLIHHNPRIYPEPWSFIPERWLPSPSPPGLPPRPEGIPQANPKYLLPFSRGTRNCIGQPLAHAELFMTLANVLRTFVRLERDENGLVTAIKGMKLYETDRRDTDMKADFGFATPEKGRGNMRIILE